MSFIGCFSAVVSKRCPSLPYEPGLAPEELFVAPPTFVGVLSVYSAGTRPPGHGTGKVPASWSLCAVGVSCGSGSSHCKRAA